jgi:hypothetical protein
LVAEGATTMPLPHNYLYFFISFPLYNLAYGFSGRCKNNLFGRRLSKSFTTRDPIDGQGKVSQEEFELGYSFASGKLVL